MWLYDQHYFYMLDGIGTLHVWKKIPQPEEEPRFSFPLGVFNGHLYSDGQYLSISGMNLFQVIQTSKIKEDAVFLTLEIADVPFISGQGILSHGKAFLAD